MKKNHCDICDDYKHSVESVRGFDSEILLFNGTTDYAGIVFRAHNGITNELSDFCDSCFKKMLKEACEYYCGEAT